jgi:hypothetical protein
MVWNHVGCRWRALKRCVNLSDDPHRPTLLTFHLDPRGRTGENSVASNGEGFVPGGRLSLAPLCSFGGSRHATTLAVPCRRGASRPPRRDLCATGGRALYYRAGVSAPLRDGSDYLWFCSRQGAGWSDYPKSKLLGLLDPKRPCGAAGANSTGGGEGACAAHGSELPGTCEGAEPPLCGSVLRGATGGG